MKNTDENKQQKNTSTEEVAEEVEEEKGSLGEEKIDIAAKNAELEDQFKRAVADYRNLEKRVIEERAEFIKFANRELLERLLPAFDALFLAEKYIQDDGLKLTIKSLYDALDQIGVKRVESVGKKFDASKMDCVETVDGESEEVIEEVRPGFTLYERTLRPALVKVGKGK
jgi:molecular chaperone GrpE